MTKQEFYDLLCDNNFQWGRYSESDKNDLYIWVSGYKTRDYHTLQEVCMTAGFMCMTATFDKQCCKMLMKLREM